jgi:hypothetical protein
VQLDGLEGILLLNELLSLLVKTPLPPRAILSVVLLAGIMSACRIHHDRTSRWLNAMAVP